MAVISQASLRSSEVASCPPIALLGSEDHLIHRISFLSTQIPRLSPVAAQNLTNFFNAIKEQISWVRDNPSLNEEEMRASLGRLLTFFQEEGINLQYDNAYLESARVYFEDESLDNFSQVLFYTLSCIASATISEDTIEYVSDPNTLSHGEILTETANGILGGFSLLAMGYFTFAIVETKRTIKKLREAQEDTAALKQAANVMIFRGKELLLASESGQRLHPLIQEVGSLLVNEGILVKSESIYKTRQIRQRLFNEKSKLNVQTLSFANFFGQTANSVTTTIGAKMQALNGSLTLGAPTLSSAVVWLGLISAVIGIVLAAASLMYFLYELYQNSQAKEDLAFQLHHLNDLKSASLNDPKLQLFIQLEEKRLQLELKKCGIQEKHLKNNLISVGICFVFSLISTPLVFMSGGLFGILSYLTIGTLLLSSAISCYRKWVLNNELQQEGSEISERYQREIIEITEAHSQLEMHHLDPSAQEALFAYIQKSPNFCELRNDLNEASLNLLPALSLQSIKHLL